MQFKEEDAARFAAIHKLLRKHQLQVMGTVFNSQGEVDRAYEQTAEKDPHRVEELISLLRAVIRDDQEEIRTRMGLLAKEYAGVISNSKAAD
jgi:hypothetical protein